MGRVEGDFEKGAAEGVEESLRVLSLTAKSWASKRPWGQQITAISRACDAPRDWPNIEIGKTHLYSKQQFPPAGA